MTPFQFATDFSWFFWIGSFDLLIMTVQDLRSGYIDDRFNYIMYGIVFAMFFVSGRPLLYFGAVFVLATCFPLATTKFFAPGDTAVLNWMLLGLGIMGPTFLGLFFITFPVCLAIHTAFRCAFKIKDEVPGLPILAATFFWIAAVYYIVW
jgi:hypothetical protein